MGAPSVTVRDAREDQAAAPPERAARPWRRAILAALAVWSVAQAAHALIAVLAALHPGGPLPGGGLSHAWYQWDSLWFARIAEHGYAASGAKAAAFFPLFPLLMALLDAVLPGDAFIAGLVIANVALVAALVLVHRLVAAESASGTAADRGSVGPGSGSDRGSVGPGSAPDRGSVGPGSVGLGSADRTLWYLVAFPTGFFLVAAYNTALFLALTVAAVYAMRRQRWWVAGLLCALASGARSAGLLLLVPFCYEYLRTHGRRIRLDALAAALVPGGLVGYMIYTWRVLGDPLAFVHAQAHWSRHLDWPWSAIGHEIAMIARQPRLFNDTGLHNLFDLGAVLLAATMIVLSFAGPWRLRRDQYALPLYGAGLLLFMVSFPNGGDVNPYPLQSAARLVLEVFPAFLILGRIGARPLVDRAYLVLAVGAQAVLLDHFLHGGWVA